MAYSAQDAADFMNGVETRAQGAQMVNAGMNARKDGVPVDDLCLQFIVGFSSHLIRVKAGLTKPEVDAIIAACEPIFAQAGGYKVSFTGPKRTEIAAAITKNLEPNLGLEPAQISRAWLLMLTSVIPGQEGFSRSLGAGKGVVQRTGLRAALAYFGYLASIYSREPSNSEFKDGMVREYCKLVNAFGGTVQTSEVVPLCLAGLRLEACTEAQAEFYAVSPKALKIAFVVGTMMLASNHQFPDGTFNKAVEEDAARTALSAQVRQITRRNKARAANGDTTQRAATSRSQW
jgi:hypothetical protein